MDITLSYCEEIAEGVVVDTCAEMCPYCENEVELELVMEIQICPACGKYIVPCAQCEHMNCSTCRFAQISEMLNER